MNYNTSYYFIIYFTDKKLDQELQPIGTRGTGLLSILKILRAPIYSNLSCD